MRFSRLHAEGTEIPTLRQASVWENPRARALSYLFQVRVEILLTWNYLDLFFFNDGYLA